MTEYIYTGVRPRTKEAEVLEKVLDWADGKIRNEYVDNVTIPEEIADSSKEIPDKKIYKYEIGKGYLVIYNLEVLFRIIWELDIEYPEQKYTRMSPKQARSMISASQRVAQKLKKIYRNKKGDE